ncbi:uncharacterized protein LOC127418134 [Myxocyprinus asiaticus]|uniref:uncharacterized protein LOC127418134 n=1 Tax=Myxocyprinus asiaticus TaxID=70543 RepID=UPI0022225710|nr:uncharacterized protein LOC127418134 [Myxocyprinus asiaticus]
MILWISVMILSKMRSQNNQHKFNVSIHQHPVSESVHPGDTVTLLCSVLSERRTPEIRMFWFRSDSGKSVPEIIYTRHRSNQCEIDSFMQSCTYSLTKIIVNQTDTGTYYCAVITCGRILFGDGTKINMIKQVDPVVIVLGVLLGVCVAIISSQAVLSHKKERYNCNREKELRDIKKEQPSSQDCDAVHLNYAALHFKKGKTKRERMKGEPPRDSVFTSVNCQLTTT